MGYDDIELARYMTPPLTTIHQPKDELGELAVDVLIHRMAQPDPGAAAPAADARAGGTKVRFSDL
jgi:DNA-binding LacI/PurR family transcriptional regulator